MFFFLKYFLQLENVWCSFLRWSWFVQGVNILLLNFVWELLPCFFLVGGKIQHCKTEVCLRAVRIIDWLCRYYANLKPASWSWKIAYIFILSSFHQHVGPMNLEHKDEIEIYCQRGCLLSHHKHWVWDN